MEKIKWPIVNNEELLNCFNAILKSNRWTTTGYHTLEKTQEQEFAEKFAKYNETEYCVLTTGGTTALQIAMEALGIGYGDEVIIPALTWIATATAVLNNSAVPVLVDVDTETLCIDSDKIEEAITKRTKAIIPVHLYGSICDMDKIMEIAKRHNLYVIEDCAQAHGSMWGNRKVGSIGNIGCFSMQQGKTLSSGEGGAVITTDKRIYSKLYQLKTDSRDIVEDKTTLRYGDMEVYEKGEIQGNNFCLSEFHCGILNCQLKYLDQQHETRLKSVVYLEKELSKIGYDYQKRLKNVTYPTFYGYAIKIKKSQQISQMVNGLREYMNLGSFFIHQSYPPINKNIIFCPWSKKKYDHLNINEKVWKNKYFENAEKVYEQYIVFHHSILLYEKQIDKIVEYLKKN